MAEVVVPRLADDVAVLAVVGVATDQAVLVLQLAVLPMHPGGAGVEALGLGDPVEQRLVGACNTEMRLQFSVARSGSVVQLLSGRIYCFIVRWPGRRAVSSASLSLSRDSNITDT